MSINDLKKGRFWVPLILGLFIMGDVVYSFFQHSSVSLDGDLPAIAVPGEHYLPVLKDPLAVNAVFRDSVYGGPNRFFAHAALWSYYRIAPAILQSLTDPVHALYLSTGLLKTGIQLLLLFLIAAAISGTVLIRNKDFLIAAVLITPLFQTFGYNGSMGIIDHAPTYAVFYAGSFSLVLLFLMPLLMRKFHGKGGALSIMSYIGLAVVALVAALSGPVNPPVIILASGLLLIYYFTESAMSGSSISKALIQLKTIPQIGLIIIGLGFSAYSMYAGLNNIESKVAAISIADRYARLLPGLAEWVSTKAGIPLLLLMLLTNWVLITRNAHIKEQHKVLRLMKWLVIFSLLYILLLPLGGYREYRPNIIRRDTLLPVLIALVFIYGLGSTVLIRHFSGRLKNSYITVTVLILLIFVNADRYGFDHNSCEQAAIRQIARSDKSPVILEEGCPVLAWKPFTTAQESRIAASFLKIVGCTHEETLFYYEVGNK